MAVAYLPLRQVQGIRAGTPATRDRWFAQEQPILRSISHFLRLPERYAAISHRAQQHAGRAAKGRGTGDQFSCSGGSVRLR